MQINARLQDMWGYGYGYIQPAKIGNPCEKNCSSGIAPSIVCAKFMFRTFSSMLHETTLWEVVKGLRSGNFLSAPPGMCTFRGLSLWCYLQSVRGNKDSLSTVHKNSALKALSVAQLKHEAWAKSVHTLAFYLFRRDFIWTRITQSSFFFFLRLSFFFTYLY